MRHLDRAWKKAQEVLGEEHVRSPRVPIERIARKYARLIEAEMDQDISGMLVPPENPIEGHRWTIVVNKTHPRTRKRFTIAHELGHLLLHDFKAPHADRGYKIRFRNQRSSDGSVVEEIEANQFAAELLMPRAMVLERLSKMGLEYAPVDEDDASSSAISELADQFEVSKAALSIRLSNLLL